MWALFLLLGMTRCVAAQPCPTDADLLSAVRSRDGAMIQAMADEAAAAEPGNIVMVHSERIRRIDNILCGERLSDDPETVHCRFRVRYWSRDMHHVAKLIQRGDKWEIVDALVVTRARR